MSFFLFFSFPRVCRLCLLSGLNGVGVGVGLGLGGLVGWCFGPDDYELVANGGAYSELGPKGIRTHSMMG